MLSTLLKLKHFYSQLLGNRLLQYKQTNHVDSV